MLFSVLCVLVVIQVLSVAPPAPPENIHVDEWLLRWTPATDGDVTYTVKYSSFDKGPWTNLPACTQISINSCHVISTKAQGIHGCVMLRVQAERHGLTSTPVEACSRRGDSCTPDFSLTARPGTLTVNLSRNHSLALDHADHVGHRVYYGMEGEPLQDYEDTAASVTISELQEGQRYCTKVQYTYHDKPVGVPSCTQCELIPESRKNPKATEILAAVVPVVVLLILIPVIAYVLIFQQRRIKQWLQPPYQIPPDFFLEPLPEHHLGIPASGPPEEHWDVISSFSQQEFRD
ncbi:interferon alpha/beta receptor 1-like [Centropristis striata]|uniref:interferon alpha/beta receptor 1-like n=1 Tax=Centropristis striata TaxID=184440 RepID=UPI0027E178D6|nr:interferon alpha/beta receptor 1-like [Centropristis striata]